MNSSVIKIHPEESVAVAARTLQRYNIGALPVCGSDGLLQGMVTDRDLVVRCMAAEGDVQQMTVGQVMTRQVVSATPDMDTGAAAHLMGRAQVRRLPVVQQGKLCGIITLGDLARRENTNPDAADALGDICSNISQR
jgi:CBS domain-containing protein